MTGAELRHLREALGLTRTQLGRALGVGYRVILDWEQATCRIAHPQLLALALEALSVRPPSERATDERATDARASEVDDTAACESCLVAGVRVLATTRSTHPHYRGYRLCAACAREYDARPR